MRHIYKTTGVCCDQITVILNGDIVEDVEFRGGCHGNLKAIRKVVGGMKADLILNIFTGLTCGRKMTSCTDQMCSAIRESILIRDKGINA